MRAKKLLNLLYLIVLVTVLIYLVQIFGINKLKDQVNSMGIWAPVGIFILRFSSIIVPALPSTAYSLMAGALLGFNKGILVICLADSVSCSLSFYLSRKYGRNLIKRLVGNSFMKKVEKYSGKHLENNFFLITGFLMTGLFDFVSYGIGLTKTPWLKFAPALALSIILSNPPVVALGAGILSGGRIFLIFALIGIFILSLITGMTQKHTRSNNTNRK